MVLVYLFANTYFLLSVMYLHVSRAPHSPRMFYTVFFSHMSFHVLLVFDSSSLRSYHKHGSVGNLFVEVFAILTLEYSLHPLTLRTRFWPDQGELYGYM